MPTEGAVQSNRVLTHPPHVKKLIVPEIEPIFQENAKVLVDEGLSPLMVAAKSIFSGTVAGVISKLVDHPLDTVKVRLQAQVLGSVPGTIHFIGTTHCLRVTIKNEGFSGLYKGAMSPITIAALENAALFVCFEQYKLYRERQHLGMYEPSVKDTMIGGALSGIVSTFIMTPVDVLKTRLQTNPNTNKYRVLIPQILKKEGFFGGLYKGTTAMALREIPGNAVWFGTYEAICLGYEKLSRCSRDEVPVSILTAAGAAAGVTYWTVPYPMDTLKTMIQNSEEKLTLAGVGRQLYAQKGFWGFYEGWGVTVLRSAPSSAIVFVAYEFMNRWLDKLLDNK